MSRDEVVRDREVKLTRNELRMIYRDVLAETRLLARYLAEHPAAMFRKEVFRHRQGLLGSLVDADPELPLRLGSLDPLP